MKLHQALACLSLALALTACGGGSYGSDPAPSQATSNEVPGSATLSTGAYTSYAGSLKASETGDPLDVSKVLAPTSETESPLPI